MRGLKAVYAPLLAASIRAAAPVVGGARSSCSRSPPARSHGSGQEFIPTLDEKNIAMDAMRIPSARP